MWLDVEGVFLPPHPPQHPASGLSDVDNDCICPAGAQGVLPKPLLTGKPLLHSETTRGAPCSTAVSLLGLLCSKPHLPGEPSHHRSPSLQPYGPAGGTRTATKHAPAQHALTRATHVAPQTPSLIHVGCQLPQAYEAKAMNLHTQTPSLRGILHKTNIHQTQVFSNVRAPFVGSNNETIPKPITKFSLPSWSSEKIKNETFETGTLKNDMRL